MAMSQTKSSKAGQAGAKMRIISQIIPLGGFILALRFDDGSTGTVDFKPTIKKGGVFKQLSDPRLFAQAVIGERGRSVLWPGDIDFDADALYMTATKSRSRRLTLAPNG
jgi:hypothetical protein